MVTPLKSRIRKWLRASSLVSEVYYGLHLDKLPVMLGWPSYSKVVNDTIRLHVPDANEKRMVQLRKDIRSSYIKYRISADEYFLFNFESLPANQRKEYLSDKLIYLTMGKLVGRKLHDIQLEDKYNFYLIAKDYFKRGVLFVSKSDDRMRFVDFTTKLHDVIIKPNSSACGNGIRVEHIHDEKSAEQVFNELISRGDEWIVEELIVQSDEMASWNESSVNTIRISSFLNNDRFSILCPFLRTGRKGAIVDNGGQGGIYACIEPETGTIITDGKDEMCHVYSEHPDSHVRYKGWQVPAWKELVELTQNVHMLFPKHKYVGWDFAYTKDGWVLIEGNWGEFIAQQSAMEQGYKKEFMDLIK